MFLSLFLLSAVQMSPPVTGSALAKPDTASKATQIRAGRQLAIENCQVCHAVGRRGKSPNAAAPQFRYLARRYPVENLSEAFAEGILVGHSVMPQFEFAPEQVTGLVAYLKSIQVPPPVVRQKRSPQ